MSQRIRRHTLDSTPPPDFKECLTYFDKISTRLVAYPPDDQFERMKELSGSKHRETDTATRREIPEHQRPDPSGWGKDRPYQLNLFQPSAAALDALNDLLADVDTTGQMNYVEVAADFITATIEEAERVCGWMVQHMVLLRASRDPGDFRPRLRFVDECGSCWKLREYWREDHPKQKPPKSLRCWRCSRATRVTTEPTVYYSHRWAPINLVIYPTRSKINNEPAAHVEVRLRRGQLKRMGIARPADLIAHPPAAVWAQLFTGAGKGSQRIAFERVQDVRKLARARLGKANAKKPVERESYVMRTLPQPIPYYHMPLCAATYRYALSRDLKEYFKSKSLNRPSAPIRRLTFMPPMTNV